MGYALAGGEQKRLVKTVKAYGTYSFKIEKRYFDADSEQYKETRYFKPEELLRLKEQVSKAYHLSQQHEARLKEEAKNEI